MKSTSYKYVGLNLVLAALVFLIGSLIGSRAAKYNPPEASKKSPDQARIIVTGRSATFPPAISKSPAEYPTAALRTNEIKNLLNGLGPLSSEQAYDKMMKLLLALAAVDPNAAVEYAVHNLKPPFQSQALTKVLGVWAGNDGVSAWNWAKKNESGNSLFTGAVLKEIASAQPDMAWQFATELAKTTPDRAAGLYVSAMSGMMYMGKYQDAARLLDSAILPPEAAQSSFGLTGLLAGQWGSFAPADAAQWVLTLPQGSNARSQALLALGQSWANVDPAQATDFASQLPASAERISMLTAGLNAWAASDPRAASQWVSSISPGADYDQFAAAIAAAPNIINSSPEDSVAWALAISDDNLKMDSLTKVFTQWFQVADVNAMAYLRQMPPAMQNELRSRLGFVISQ
jgi:hypothetical protein